MRLYILRHGLAGNRAKWQSDDTKRPLTARGKKRMALEAKRLTKLGIKYDAILTSPLVRAYQTAEIVAEYMQAKSKIIKDDRLSPGFAIDCLSDILRDHASATRLLLVGHEPDLSETIGNLIGGGRVVLKKGGIACLDLADPSSMHGELLWLLTPRMLE